MDSRSVSKHIEELEYQSKPHRLLTLIFPLNPPRAQVLLGLKKRGFGQNKYNGFGGKVEPQESISQGAIRELTEESCLRARSVNKRGVLFFYFENDPVTMEVHVFDTVEYEGEWEETEEMAPKWFGVGDMPFDRMWKDDERWWPMFIRGKKFIGRFWFLEDQVTIVREELAEVDSLEF
ncbi:hypothetical protein LPJ66_005487 [Kickxella alabastrina]|uniref:Uncharacterized protein n=1 Tax=Kickxella alabastrina TaxID=61397 RepID=A0ACC1IID0_9FUNG|nr:hypothetical protein LPJ66_005487 [Kickxella alabastrina]